MSLIFDTDYYDCPLCDGVTPAADCDECGDTHCAGCLAAYGCEWCE